MACQGRFNAQRPTQSHANKVESFRIRA
jgi:hypothetical protein